MFLKNKNIIFKIRRSKVTDYAALNLAKLLLQQPGLLSMQGGLNFAHRQDISHVFRVAPSLYFFDSGLILHVLQKYSFFLLNMQAAFV